MRILNSLMLLSLSYSLISCGESKKYNYHNTYNDDKEILKENKIHKITETKIEYDIVGNPIWKRTESIRLINDEGLCILEIQPRYEVEGKSAKDYLTKGYIYKGFSDTISYEYDPKNQLMVKKETFHENDGYPFGKTTEYSYDLNGNKILECESPDEASMSCWYFKFTYGKDNEILNRKDSIDYELEYDFSKPFEYKYDTKGNLLNDGNYEYKLDKNGNPVEFIPQFGLYGGYKRKYNEENKIIEEWGSYYFNDVQKKLMYVETPITQYKYNLKSLIAEKKISLTDKLYTLFKYQYE